MKGSDLDRSILVGGPTYSPILHKMLKDQITSKVNAKNQMTSVAVGAALYASTKDVGVAPPPPPTGTIALELKYESDCGSRYLNKYKNRFQLPTTTTIFLRKFMPP